MLPRLFVGACAVALSASLSFAEEPKGSLTFEPEKSAHFQFHGFVQNRVQANIENWLLPAPQANPGLIEMFRVRDRQPRPNLVPWAGEFVGKYLISAIQALRMSNDDRLLQRVDEVVSELIATQAEDGYLGPFPKEERLLKHWDLWGHYHVMLGLLMWHERTGSPEALASVRRAADLVCRIYLDSDRRPIEAGDDEMNLSIIHALGWLYRITGEDRYFRMMQVIEKDWEKGGDYLRAGLEGIEFFETRRPRWESLHNLQGLVELYRITGEEKYRQAFEHHWRSIARWDLRNTGGFSSGEKATGNPYAPTPIETCCTIAWMALSTDMLALTGDSRVGDMLEISTLNGWAGAQHPSGRWCTYSTPMDGMREASAHTIVFQSRHGTPELNCCSVNGPRGWGLLSEWGLMKNTNGFALNWLGPVTISATHDGTPVRFRLTGDYPAKSEIKIEIDPAQPLDFELQIRVPAWAKNAVATINGDNLQNVQPGKYLGIKRQWTKGDSIALRFVQELRVVPGAKEANGKVSLYRGPILLAWDQRFHEFDENSVPALDLDQLQNASIRSSSETERSRFRPMLLVEVPAWGKGTLKLCDFATAGATGTRYRSWLDAENPPPAPVVSKLPRDGARIPSGKNVFAWNAPQRPPAGTSYTIEISDSSEFHAPVREFGSFPNRQTILELGNGFEPGQRYYWRVVSAQGGNTTHCPGPAPFFVIDPSLPPAEPKLQPPPPLGSKGEVIIASLKESPAPEFGSWKPSDGWKSIKGDRGGLALNGVNERLIYEIGEWPEESFTASVWFRVRELPRGRIGQVFSAWAGGSDDPLRLTVDGSKLFARIEAGHAYSTPGIPIEPGSWYHVAAVKDHGQLRLYLDGKEVGSCPAPEYSATAARDFALGGNPHYAGNEFLAADFSGLAFYARALALPEITAAAKNR